jgi:hypothetical protein
MFSIEFKVNCQRVRDVRENSIAEREVSGSWLAKDWGLLAAIFASQILIVGAIVLAPTLFPLRSAVSHSQIGSRGKHALAQSYKSQLQKQHSDPTSKVQAQTPDGEDPAAAVHSETGRDAGATSITK